MLAPIDCTPPAIVAKPAITRIPGLPMNQLHSFWHVIASLMREDLPRFSSDNFPKNKPFNVNPTGKETQSVLNMLQAFYGYSSRGG
jgi:hypothetical protein